MKKRSRRNKVSGYRRKGETGKMEREEGAINEST